jgi:hypothetical protein
MIVLEADATGEPLASDHDPTWYLASSEDEAGFGAEPLAS